MLMYTLGENSYVVAMPGVCPASVSRMHGDRMLLPEGTDSPCMLFGKLPHRAEIVHSHRRELASSGVMENKSTASGTA